MVNWLKPVTYKILYKWWPPVRISLSQNLWWHKMSLFFNDKMTPKVRISYFKWNRYGLFIYFGIYFVVRNVQLTILATAVSYGFDSGKCIPQIWFTFVHRYSVEEWNCILTCVTRHLYLTNAVRPVTAQISLYILAVWSKLSLTAKLINKFAMKSNFLTAFIDQFMASDSEHHIIN